MNSSLFSRINTTTVTKLVLIAEILAISILHTVKSNHEQKQADVSSQQVGNYPSKNLGSTGNITLANNQNSILTQ